MSEIFFKELLIELCQNVAGSSFLRHRHGNHAAGSKPILKLFNL